MKNKIYKISIILVLPLLLNSCIYKEITVNSVKNYKIKNITDEGIDISATLVINNPNFYKIKVKSMSFNLYFNKDYLGKCNLNNEIIITKKSISENNINLKIKFKKYMNKAKLLQLATESFFQGGIKIKLNGELKAGALFITKRIAFNYSKQIEFEDVKSTLGI